MQNQPRLPILLQIVLYRQPLVDCATYKSLLQASQDWHRKTDIYLSIWDNSEIAAEPTVQSPFQLIAWKHQPKNTGLVEAYNAAIDTAKTYDLPWIMLLDQDTKVTKQYLQSVSENASAVTSNVVALAPKILVDGIQRSPNGHIFECPIGSIVCQKSGVSESLIYCINSGMLVRTGFLAEIGGYSTDYRLDAVDHWFCREVYRRGKKIAVLPIEFEHGLSVYDNEKYVSLSRYRSIMEAQTTFALSARTTYSKLLYALMLLVHAISQAIRRPGKGYATLAILEWFRFLRKWALGK